MTTLKDLIEDFTIELEKMFVATQDDANRDYEMEKEELIAEYIRIIKERLIGE